LAGRIVIRVTGLVIWTLSVIGIVIWWYARSTGAAVPAESFAGE